MCDLTTRFLLILFKKALIWARFEFALGHYLKLGWKPFLLLKYLLNLFPLNETDTVTEFLGEGRALWERKRESM